MKMNLTTTDFVPANKVKIPEIYFHRLKTGLEEVDEFLGGASDKCEAFSAVVYILLLQAQEPARVPSVCN